MSTESDMIPTRLNQVISGFRVLGFDTADSQFFTVIDRCVTSTIALSYKSRYVNTNKRWVFPTVDQLRTHKDAIRNYFNLLYFPVLAGCPENLTFYAVKSKNIGCYSIESDEFMYYQTSNFSIFANNVSVRDLID